MAKKTPTASDGVPAVLVPSTTAFDFHNGAFARSERTRLTGLILNGAALVAAATCLLLGVQGLAASYTSQDELTSASTHLTQVYSELSTLDSAGGFSTQELTAHIKTRQSTLTAAVGGEVDTIAVIEALQTSAPSGVSITSITFGSASQDSSDSSSGKEAAVSSAPPTTVTIEAVASGFALLSTWSTALAAVPAIAGPDLTWSGGGDHVSVTVTATLTDAALSSRAVDNATSSSGGDAVKTPAAATAPSTDGDQ